MRARPAAAIGVGPVERGGRCPHQPGVDGEPVPAGGLLDAGLEVVGQAEVDAGHRSFVAFDGRKRLAPVTVRRLAGRHLGRRCRHHELELPTPEAHLDRPRRELDGDLLGGRGQGVLHGEPDGRIEGGGEPGGHRLRFLAARLGRNGQLALEALDIQTQVHGTTMMP